MRAIDTLKEFLNDNGIEYTEKRDLRYEKNWCIQIVLEADCTWINGFNKPMKYDKVINIQHDRYGYKVVETKGYNLSCVLTGTGKVTTVIDVLNKRLNFAY